ncbi:MAG: hypothetical protein ACRD1P_00880 [Thermoanaerobaculia bacterium]
MAEQRESGGLARERSAFRRRRRSYGYRGYGSGFHRGAARDAGMVHWAGGFSGFGFPGNSGGLTLPRVGLFTEGLSGRGLYTGLGPAQKDPPEDSSR